MSDSTYQFKKSWLLIGHYGGQNTGDEAMLAGLLANNGRNRTERFKIVYKGQLPNSINRFGAKYIQPEFRLVLTELIKCDGIIIGGGTHFQDDLTTQRYLRHLRYMFRFVGISFLAKLLNKKVLWLSMGFGPFYRMPSRLITKMGLKSCDFVTVRDSTSKMEVADWISPRKIDLAFDLAALLRTDFNPNSIYDYRENQLDPTLGVSVTSVKLSKTGGDVVGKIFWDRFQRSLKSLLQQIDNLKIRIFIFRGGNRESDNDISYQLFHSLAHFNSNRVEIIPYNPDPFQVLLRMFECQFFIATRFHSGILSYLSDSNLLFLAYHRKLIDLAKEIGLPAEATIQIDDNITESQIRERVYKLVTSPNMYRPSLPISEAVNRAMKNIDTIKYFEEN